MEQYIVSARKYRPATFASVVGQQALTSTLKNSIANDRLAHAYLFCGSRGVGKTSCARIFAKTINCTARTADGEACNECDSCRQFNENRSMNIVELDAASHNGVEDIKALIDQVMVPPSAGRYRVFIIDEVHMLTQAAFNAFLKTLEEPPAHAVFILATTEKHKIIPTILSRCQIYDFNRISIADMVRHMESVAAAEGIATEPAALNLIARKADGGMRDALSIFDQIAASTRGNITYTATLENLNVLDSAYFDRLFDAFVEKDVTAALLIYKEIRERGFDSQFFLNGLALYLRDVMVAANPATISLLEAPDDVRENMAARAAKVDPGFLYRAMELCNDADFNFRQASNKQFLVELTLIRLCQPAGLSPDESGSDERLLMPLEDFIKSSAAPQDPAPVAGANHTGYTPPQRPAAHASTAIPASTAPVANRTARALGGLSLSKRNDFAQASSRATTTAAPSVPTQLRDRDFSDADLESAWERLAKSFVGEPMLTSVLVAIKPERQGTAVTLTVGTDIQAEAVRKFEPQIRAMLCDSLSNDKISTAIEVCQGDIPPAFWTEQQVLEHLTAQNPAVAEMISKYKMRLT